jgi:hypothetical protein
MWRVNCELNIPVQSITPWVSNECAKQRFDPLCLVQWLHVKAGCSMKAVVDSPD